MGTWQVVICAFVVAAVVLAFCSGVKAVCRKKLKQNNDQVGR